VKCPDGSDRSFEMGAALVRKMHPMDWNGNKETTAKSFASSIGDRWGVGDPGCNNGVLLFLSLEDRYAYIKTASTSHQVLTDRLSETVVGNMKPLLREEKYDDALLQAVLQVNDVLLGREIPGSTGEGIDWTSLLIIGAIAIMFFGPFVAMALLFCLRVVLTPVAWLLDRLSFFRGRRAAEHDLRRVQQELDRDEFDQTMCPICLDQLSPNEASVLDCRHRFHRRCVEPWLAEHVTCPLCRSEVEAPIAPEDEDRPQEYQRRLRFYLSRLGSRHPRFFSNSDSAAYRRSRSGTWMYYQDYYAYGHHGRSTWQDPSRSLSCYTSTLESRYQSAMQSARAVQRSMAESARSSGSSGGSSSGFGGGGGFSSGGGGGGGGW